MSTKSEKSLQMQLSRMLSNRLDGRAIAYDAGEALHEYMIDYGRWCWCEMPRSMQEASSTVAPACWR